MPKKRLIDATDLVRRVLEERDKIRTEGTVQLGVPTPDRHGMAMRGGIRKALREIETSPTVDAVEVVRCVNCVWYCEWHTKPDVFLCGRPNNNAIVVKPDFFCKYGERKEDSSEKGN